MTTINRIVNLIDALSDKRQATCSLTVATNGLAFVTVMKAHDQEEIATNGLFADVVAWLESEVGDLAPAAYPYATDELRRRFERTRDRLKAERRMRDKEFAPGHPQRYQKLQDIDLIIEDLVWMKDLLKPLAEPEPEQP